MLSETQILSRIRTEGLMFPPFCFRLSGLQVPIRDFICDAVFEAEWKGLQLKFAAEIRRYSSDRSILDAVRQARYAAEQLDALPLIITPWLSPEQLERLEEEGTSGIDLSGNGIVVVPGSVLVVRSGKPNAFPDSRAVKNVYEGSSSLVARAFLLQTNYSSVNEILEAVQARNGAITQSTVSKALKQLEEDLVIWREKGLIKLLQASKLLDRLVGSFKAPRIIEQVTGKIDLDLKEMPLHFMRQSEGAEGQVIITGASSVNRYATMVREPVLEMYCSGDLRQFFGKNVKVDLNSRFPNFRLIRTEEQTVFFDARIEDGVRWASPLQSYLELMNGDKREKETAEQLRQYILKEMGRPDLEPNQ